MATPDDGSSTAPAARSPRTVRRAARNKEDLLARAGAVVAERGFEATRFSDVATHTGASVSTLQYLFGNREDLVVQALRARTRRMLTEAHRLSGAIEDPLERLRWVADHLAAHDDDSAVARDEWMLWVEYWRAALRDEELATESLGAYDEWLRLVRDAVAAAVSAGVVRQPDDVDLVAQGACAVADGLGIQIALGRPGATWQRARLVTRSWLAAALDCPELLR
ncbi:TetR family transcriptional regulator C-terminal domain-containing protein [Streptomyces sp. NPDC001833]|uniref:TetR family transcriptional regulator C-terminal domain-containing protein n=1 Tax=Streptomyces sp. NPDC001833 TaxID=3154658 RepID=UPI00333162CC